MSSNIELTQEQQPEYDYVVVGSGAGGGPLAANLAKAGYNSGFQLHGTQAARLSQVY